MLLGFSSYIRKFCAGNQCSRKTHFAFPLIQKKCTLNVRFHLNNNIDKHTKKTHSFTSHKVVPAPATNWFTTPWTSTIYLPSTQHISYKPIYLMTSGTTKIEEILHQLEVNIPCSNPTIPVFHRNPGIPSDFFHSPPALSVPAGLELEGEGRQPALRRRSTSSKVEGSEALQVW